MKHRPQTLTAANLALFLRVLGFTFDEIGAAVGCNRSNACQLVKLAREQNDLA